MSRKAATPLLESSISDSTRFSTAFSGLLEWYSTARLISFAYFKG